MNEARMNGHLARADYNWNFQAELQHLFPQDYFDWKISAVFYAALHLVDAYAAFADIRPFNNHEQRFYHLDSSNPDAELPLSAAAFKLYRRLYRYSINARYDEIGSIEAYEKARKNDHKDAVERFKEFRRYLKEDVGLPIG